MGKDKPQIILFGDSITEHSFQTDKAGWGATLANHYARKADVVMRGFGGYNSRLAVYLLDTVFPTDYSIQYTTVVTRWSAALNLTWSVLSTPALIQQAAIGDRPFRTVWMQQADGGCPMSNEVIKTYADECVKVAKELGLPVINLWSTFMATPDWIKYSCDGVHLSAEGNAKLFEELLKVMEDPSLVPTVKAAQMPIDFPHFLDLGSDPEGTVKNFIAKFDK